MAFAYPVELGLHQPDIHLHFGVRHQRDDLEQRKSYAVRTRKRTPPHFAPRAI
jgi:hypothetical protein